MSSSKPLALGVSATATVAGSSAALTAPSAYKSILFPGVTEDSTSLFPAFDLKGVKETFSNLQYPDSIKQPIYGLAEAQKFQLETAPTTSTPSGEIQGRFKIDLKHYKDSSTSKGNLAAKLEMSVSKGDYGIILLNSISNMLKNGGYGFLYRALFLKKEQNNWNIKAGVQWHDKHFVNVSKTKWTLPENETIDNVFWNQKICFLSESCETQLKQISPENKSYTYEWQSNSTSPSVWKALRIEAVPNISGTAGNKPDFWNDQELPLLTQTSIVGQPQAIFVNGYWGQTNDFFKDGSYTNFQNWLNIFRGVKGEWKKKTI